MTNLVFFLLYMFFQSGDWLYVINVRGSVQRAREAKNIAVGDSIRATDKLVFDASDDQVVALHPLKGRFVIKALQPQPAEGKLERIFVTVSESLVPSGSKSFAMGRAAPIQTLADLKTFLSSNAIRDSFRLVLVTDYYIPVAIPALADSPHHFFYLQYSNDSLAENVRVPVRRQGKTQTWHLQFSKKIMPKTLGATAQNLYTPVLYYYDDVKEESTRIGKMFIVPADTPLARQEYQALHHALSGKYAGKPDEQFLLQQEIQQYFIDKYVLQLY